MRGWIKGLVLVVLGSGVFGGGGYVSYRLFLEPELELKRELENPALARPAFEDGTEVEYRKCLEVEGAGDPLAARRSYEEFLQSYPDSSKAEEARYRLGAIQLSLLFAPRMVPGKELYVVKAGDVLLKICHRLKVAPELLMAMNRLESSALRVGQKLYWVRDDFSVVVDRAGSKVLVLKGGEFFAQARVLSTQGAAWVGAPSKKSLAVPVQAKVFDKPGWKDGQRIGVGEKGYAEAWPWVVLQPGGVTLYAEPGAEQEGVNRPVSGYGLEPEVVRALSALLRKGESVSIR